jgi:hypothetical protein
VSFDVAYGRLVPYGETARRCGQCGTEDNLVKWMLGPDPIHYPTGWRCERCAAREQLRYSLRHAKRILPLLWRSIRNRT